VPLGREDEKDPLVPDVDPEELVPELVVPVPELDPVPLLLPEPVDVPVPVPVDFDPVPVPPAVPVLPDPVDPLVLELPVVEPLGLVHELLEVPVPGPELDELPAAPEGEQEDPPVRADVVLPTPVACVTPPAVVEVVAGVAACAPAAVVPPVLAVLVRSTVERTLAFALCLEPPTRAPFAGSATVAPSAAAV
jgi:hypothetical protein